MTEFATAWMLGCTTGFFLGVTVAGRSRPASLRDRRSLPDWRRSITFPDPDPWRRPTNPYTGLPVQPNPPPSRP